MEFLLTAIIQGLAFAALGCGVYLSLRILRVPDITTDGSYALGGCMTALLITYNIHPLLILIAVLISGAVAGYITGLIHTRWKVNALLSGILVTTALYSVNLIVLGRPNLPVGSINNYFSLFGSLNFNSSYLTGIALFTVIVIALLGLFLQTDLGIALRASGDSATMASAQSIHVNRMKRGGLALANACTALSGYLLVQYQGFADINMGIGIVITGLAAVMIGEAMFSRSNSYLPWKHLIAVAGGSILFRLVLAGSLAAGLDPVYLRLFTSAIVLLIVVTGRKANSLSL